MRVLERLNDGSLAAAQVGHVFAFEVGLYVDVLVLFKRPEAGEDLAQKLILLAKDLLDDSVRAEALLEFLEGGQVEVD